MGDLDQNKLLHWPDFILIVRGLYSLDFRVKNNWR